MDKVNLSEKLAQFSDQWKLKIVGELNGQQVNSTLNTGNVQD